MFKQKPFPFSLLILVTLVSLHLIGSYLSWYWTYSWFDILVHIFSGWWIALLFLWLASILGQINSLKEYKIKSFLIALISAILFGVVWELVENLGQITSVNTDLYSWNTASDIISDACGGVLAYLFFILHRKYPDKATDILHPFYNQTGLTKN
jgi:hypothetical protein